MTRGFLQIAGFTFGKATSFFDIVPGASFAYNAGMFFHPDTGDAGKMLAAYTAQFGNGLSGTIALEQARVRGISRGVGYVPGAIPTYFGDGGTAGTSDYPDLVGNIRLDQSWGSWLVGAALHSVRGQYFNNGVVGNALNTQNLGGPSSELGWAVTTGFIWNMPWIAPGDRLSAGFVYSVGAIGYAAVTPSGATYNRFNGSEYSLGFWQDAIYPAVGAVGAFGVGGDLEMTTAWSMSAAFEHLWTPALKTSIYGSYIDVSNGAAGNALICNGGTAFTARPSGPQWLQRRLERLEHRFADAVGAG